MSGTVLGLGLSYPANGVLLSILAGGHAGDALEGAGEVAVIVEAGL